MAADGPGTQRDADRSIDSAADDDGSETSHPHFASYAGEEPPQASVGAPGKDGVLELQFASAADGTDLVYDYATVPFHVSGTLGHDPHPDAETVFVQSPTGGIAQGDRHDVRIEVGPDAIAHVSTQSSTKVQSMDCNYAAAETTLSVAAAGHLDYVPEPTILHADSRYVQTTTLDLAPGATAILSEVVVPGRLARGECFDFERYRSQIRGRRSEEVLFEDSTEITPADDDPTAPGALGEFTVYGTTFVVAPDRDTETMSDDVHAVVRDGDARAGATELPNGAGVAVRALGDRAETVQATLYDAWNHARQALLDAPAPTGRKY